MPPKALGLWFKQGVGAGGKEEAHLQSCLRLQQGQLESLSKYDEKCLGVGCRGSSLSLNIWRSGDREGENNDKIRMAWKVGD